MLRFFALLSTAFAAFTFATPPSLSQPQYLCLNKMYGCTTEHQGPSCWNENVPSTLSQSSIDALLASVNGSRGAPPARLLCVGYQFNVLDGASEVTKLASLNALLALSEANDLPVVVAVDPFEFWTGRPDLYNWWNASLPGFSDANRANVEWTGPTAANATAIAWANWGAQFRKPPHPNLASPAFRAAGAAAVRPLAARLAAWFTETLVPSGREHLLAAMKVSWEAWVGTNYFHYAHGNSYVNLPPSGDPTVGISASVQVGYAAVCTADPGACPPEGAPLTQAQVDGVLHDYLEWVAGVAAAEGLPRHKLLTHAGTYFGAPPAGTVGRVVFNSPAPAITTHAKPGWSLYTNAHDPASAVGLASALGALDGAPWAATEWRYMGGNSGAPVEQWLAAIEHTFAFHNNRMIDVYNWDDLPSAALAAVQLALTSAPACLVDGAAQLAAVRLNTTSVRLSWTPAAGADAVKVLASSLALTLPSGVLAAPNIAAESVPPSTASFDLTSAAEDPPVYWMVSSRGCGDSQLAASAVEQLAV